ncbi:anti-sigma-F factor Fin family protein [Oceanobacillus massiliensis]|uniref:anti-sigma-F factor Fin family protein n=1 Tax=Oceanobacillus massiliensis TaxID=1465765 RepID=UPI00028932A1|nr:anti-sigma-F factor Fin family protein [Oceanobacillus massiliensis]
MAIIYNCRHCGQTIGKLEQKVMDASLLGLNQLSNREMEEMVHYSRNGDIQIHTICENCEQALGQHPHYHELDFFIQ